MDDTTSIEMSEGFIVEHLDEEDEREFRHLFARLTGRVLPASDPGAPLDAPAQEACRHGLRRHIC